VPKKLKLGLNAPQPGGHNSKKKGGEKHRYGGLFLFKRGPKGPDNRGGRHSESLNEPNEGGDLLEKKKNGRKKGDPVTGR